MKPKKPRTWNTILKQEGVVGLVRGEDIKIENEWKRYLLRRKK